MRHIKRFSLLFIIAFIVSSLCLSRASFAASGPSQNRPESLSTSEQDIPVERVEVKSKTWLWVLLALAAGGAAAAAGGGGGGGGGNSGGNGGDTGSVTGSW